MARSTKMSESPLRDNIYDATPPPSHQRRSNDAQPSPSPSPATSVSSDKENRSSRAGQDKGKGRAPMAPPRVPTSNSNEQGRRKRPAESEQTNERTRRRRTVEVNEEDSELEYDPDQDIEVRRKLRKGLRDLSKNLLQNRTEFMAPNSTGLRDTLIKANELSGQVKQTADATIDSRLLVTAADYSYKKTVALISGDTAQGVDVEEFISRCLAFMRQGGGADVPEPPTNTQRRRGGRAVDEDDVDDENDGNDGNVADWAYLGRNACIMHNSRPSVPGFLLGPLSVQKRVRAQVVRRAALRPNNIRETRPEVLEASDIHKSETNLTTLCTQILARFGKVQLDAMNAVDAQSRDDMSGAEIDALMDRYSISTFGGLSLYNFIVNPHSFGQTVENLFYVSFLIRDGKLGITDDLRGLPYLVTPANSSGSGKGNGAKHQAVLSLDMASWKELIDAFAIDEPMIKHREEEEDRHGVGQKGWYA